jgi:hypothetical protein
MMSTCTRPSNLVLTAARNIPPACESGGQQNNLQSFEVTDISGSLDNWQRALCAPASELSWKGAYDPAYQPQQQALTLGLTCTFVCELHQRPIKGPALRKLAYASASETSASVGTYCRVLPRSERQWAAEKTFGGLAGVAARAAGTCGC